MIAFLILSFCTTNVTAKIQDEQGRPIQGASIQYRWVGVDDRTSAATDKDGETKLEIEKEVKALSVVQIEIPGRAKVTKRNVEVSEPLVLTVFSEIEYGGDILGPAVAAGPFKTLAAALSAADLVETLKGDGPFTLFAPTDEAFAKLPKGTVEELLKPENKGRLAGILTYHVVPGKLLAHQVIDLMGAKTLNGQRVDIKLNGSRVMVDGANVIATNIQWDNGVIHVIDSVILPTYKNIPETADSTGKFKILLSAVKAAGLVEALSGNGPFTVFAPTDEAFGKLPRGTVEELLKPENKQKLADILKYHILPGRVYSEDAVKTKTAKTLQGSSIRISVGTKGAMINGSILEAIDLDASNGVIHIIDSVLMPPAKGADARRKLENAITKAAGHEESDEQHDDALGMNSKILGAADSNAQLSERGQTIDQTYAQHEPWN